MTSSAQQRPRHLFIFIGWTLLALVLGALILSGRFNETVDSLRSARLVPVLALICIGVFLPVVHAARWSLLLAMVGSILGKLHATRITAIASLVNYAAPGFLGMPVKALLARERYNVAVSRSGPTLIVEQTLDALLLLLAGFLVLLLSGPAVLGELADRVSSQSNSLTWMVLFGLPLAGIIGVLALVFVRRKFPGFMAGVSETSHLLVRNRAQRLPVAGLTFSRWMLDMAAFWVAGAAVGVTPGMLAILLIGNLSLVAGLLAPVPGGVGIREAVMAAVAVAIGVSVPGIIALAIVHRAGLTAALPIAWCVSYIPVDRLRVAAQ